MTDVRLKKGLILLEQGRYQEAALTFQEVLSTDADDDYALYLLAYAQYHLPKSEEAALASIQTAIAKDPQHGEYYRLKGLIFSDLKRYADAEESVRKAVTLDPFNPDHQAALAYIAICQEQWQKGEVSAREALALDADHMMAGNLLATSLQMQNRLDENQALVSDLLAKDPHDALSHSNAGWVYFRKEDFVKAREHFREALRLNPNFEPARIGMLETLKARSFVYRLYVRYTFWMSRLPQRSRIMFIIGAVVVVRLLQRISGLFGEETGTILGALIAVAYLLFVMWTWFAESVGNLIILKDPFARYALQSSEKQEAVIVGGSLLSGIPLFLIGLFTNRPWLMVSGGVLVAQTIPWTVIFRRSNRMTFLIMGGFLICMWCAALAAVWAFTRGSSDIGYGCSLALAVLFAVSTWVATALFARRV